MKSYPSIDQNEIRDTLKDFFLFFRSLARFIFDSLQRFIVIFILLLLLLTGVGHYFFRENSQNYTATMVCSYNYLHKKIYGEMIHRANYLAATHSYNTLSEELNIPIESATKIVGLEARNIAGSPLHEDITKDQLPIYITAIVSDKEVFPVLQDGIMNYFNNKIPFQQNRMELEEVRLKNNINFLSHTISQIDSLIFNYSYNLSRLYLQNDSTSAMMEISRLIQQKTDLNAQLLGDQKMLGLLMSVEVLYGFAPTEHPNLKTGHSLSKIILIAIIVSLICVVFLHLVKPKNQFK